MFKEIKKELEQLPFSQDVQGRMLEAMKLAENPVKKQRNIPKVYYEY